MQIIIIVLFIFQNNKDCDSFEALFKLVVCTNNLFDVESNDDGTWRRIRKIDFISKFVDEDKLVDYKDCRIFMSRIRI